MMLSESELQSFQEKGYVCLRNFFNISDVLKINQQIIQLCYLISKKHNVNLDFEGIDVENFDVIYDRCVQLIPEFHKRIYDGIKNLPAFMQMVCAQQNLDIASELLDSVTIGIAARSFGIRIDCPKDEIFKTDWHQDFHFHARSTKGLVFWIPLVKIEESMGPLEILSGSHQEGIKRLFKGSQSEIQPSEYTKLANSVKIEGISELLMQYPKETVTASPGDLIVFDYRTIHQSGFNHSERSRWAIQIRYFDFNNEWGISNGWIGSITSGLKYEDVIPEFMIEE